MNSNSSSVTSALRFFLCLACLGLLSPAQAAVIVDDFTVGDAAVAVGAAPPPATAGPTVVTPIGATRDITTTNSGVPASLSSTIIGGGVGDLATSNLTTMSMQTLAYTFPAQSASSGDAVIFDVTTYNQGIGPDADVTVTVDSNSGAQVESFPLTVIDAGGTFVFPLADLATIDLNNLTSLELKFSLEQGTDLTITGGVIFGPPGVPEPSTIALSICGLFALVATRRRRRRI